MLSEAALAEAPDGLSFESTTVPDAYRGAVKFMMAVNGTELVDIQSARAWATPCPIIRPSPSAIVTGNVAPLNHPPPVTVPVIVIGEVTVSPS